LGERHAERKARTGLNRREIDPKNTTGGGDSRKMP